MRKELEPIFLENPQKEAKSKQEKRKNITLFMIIVFSILLAMTTGIQMLFTRLLFQIILFIAQLIVVKGLLDDVYSV